VVPHHEQQDQPSRDDPEAEALAHLSATEAAQLLLTHLTTDQCDVLMLRVYGGLEVSEVAAAMDHTDTWVRVTQHRAIQRLSRRLGSQMDVTQ
jgi:RNA polymerase sigma-70 factor (ECF subfamily)